MTQPRPTEPQGLPPGQAPSQARRAAGLARALSVLAFVFGAAGLVQAVVCVAIGAGESNTAWLMAGGAFLLVGLGLAALLWAAGRLAGKMARLALENAEVSRRLEARPLSSNAPEFHRPLAAPAPDIPVHRPDDYQAVLDAIEQLRADVLLTDEQRRERAARAAAARIEALAARAGEDIADGQLDAAQERLGELALLGAGPERIAPLRGQLARALVAQAEEAIVGGQLDQARRGMEQIAQLDPAHEALGSLRGRIRTFFAERADRAILAGDFRRAEDWLDELSQAGPDDPRLVELRSRLQKAQADVVAIEFTKFKKTIEDMLAVADYDRAEAAVESMIERLGVTEETRAFADSVRSEASAFREEQRGRMLAEVRQYAEGRQWRKALDAARELVAEHPRSRQAEEIRPTILLLEENARIEEVRELRDRVADLIERKRFAEAVELAEDLIHRFPDTQVAGQLTREMDKLRKRAGMNDLL